MYVIETRRAIKVMEAYANGKTVVVRPKDSSENDWAIVSEPEWDWRQNYYKVQEEPKDSDDTATMEGLADDVRCLRDMVESQERYLNKLKRFLNI
jgi:hypothetical protein